jgi:hypothetical protein
MQHWINTLTARRNEIAGEMLEILEGAEFGGAHVVPWRAEQLIFQAGQLLASVD